MSVKSVIERRFTGDESDPVVNCIFQLLEKRMNKHPDDIVAVNPGQLHCDLHR